MKRFYYVYFSDKPEDPMIVKASSIKEALRCGNDCIIRNGLKDVQIIQVTER